MASWLEMPCSPGPLGASGPVHEETSSRTSAQTISTLVMAPRAPSLRPVAFATASSASKSPTEPVGIWISIASSTCERDAACPISTG